MIETRLWEMRNRQEADHLRAPARPKKKLEKARRQSRKRKVVPRHSQTSHELHTPRDTHIIAESPGNRDGNNQVVGVAGASNQPAITQAPSPRRAHPPASPREMGRNRTRKREAEQMPTGPENGQQEISRKRVSARPTNEPPSSPRNPRAQPERSPIRPPRTGFRVPSVSSQESLQATRTFRVPSASSAESLQGPGRSPIRPPVAGFRVPSVSSQESLQATKTSLVPSASSAESLQGRGRSPIRPIKTRLTAPSVPLKETFGGERPSPIRRPMPPPLLRSTSGPGPGIGNAKSAQLPEASQNTDPEGPRQFQSFSESKAQYPLPDDFSDEEEW
ncbi:hypothetical protein F5883DRAFT_588896 [Diaporthe sp. PMI_573]|nr:hypothetical protein F5883DRAFT_588896 [Diaporthaceae sp. PMI_573]